MFIEVIPFGGSIDSEWLTYFVRDELAEGIRIGCLVEVPFRNAIDYAIVTSTESSEIPEAPKSIVRIVTHTPLLTAHQISVIFDVSAYYFVHTHLILSLFLSKSLVRYLEKKIFSGLVSQTSGGDRISGDTIGFYHHTNDTPFFLTLQEYITERTVMVFPDDFSIDAYLSLHPIDTETTLVITDKLTETKKHKAFCSVYNGEKDIIIWTRRILYHNLSRYDRILYIEDSLHKTAMRFGHAYKHLEILRRMALGSNFNICILSTLPSIESMYLIHTGTYRRLPNQEQSPAGKRNEET